MTKIFGLCSESVHFLQLPTIVERMYEESSDSHPSCREVWSDDCAGLGHFNIGAFDSERQPIIDTASSAVAVYCGKIVNYQSEYRCLHDEGIVQDSPDSDARFLLHWIQHKGSEAFRRINGVFSLAVWEPATRTLSLVTDRYGFRPLYYYHDRSRGLVAFASDLRSVLATGIVPLRVNWRAVNTFLHFGHLLGDDTLFEGVHRVPGASVFTFVANEHRVDQYWRLSDIDVRGRMTLDEAVDGCVSLFRQAISRQLGVSRARHVVTLSGGQDSRHIAAELRRQGDAFTAYTTTGFKPLVADKVLAAEVTRALGVPHVYVPLPPHGFLTEYWPRAHALVDYETNLHQWALPLVDSLPNEAHVNFDGILGDLFSDDLFMNARDYKLAIAGKIDELASRILDWQVFPAVFHTSIERHLDRQVLYETVRRTLEPFRGHPHLTTFATLAGRTRRAIALFAFKLVIRKAESFFPFADNDYFDFAMSIPPEYKMDHRLHRRILNRAYPELCNVLSTREINKRDYYLDEINYFGQKRQYLWKRLWELLRGRSWVFNRRTALPRMIRDVSLSSLRHDGRFFACNPAIVVLAEWFERYFPDGVD